MVRLATRLALTLTLALTLALTFTFALTLTLTQVATVTLGWRERPPGALHRSTPPPPDVAL